MPDATRWPCCDCCPGDDPEFHERNGADAHEGPCPTCDAVTSRDAARLRAERDSAIAKIQQLREWRDTHGHVLALDELRELDKIIGDPS